MRHKNLLGQIGSFSMISVILLALATPQPAAAKGLLDTIFGFLGGKPATHSPALRGSNEPTGRAPDRVNPFSGAGERESNQAVSGQYKTVCVRLCDGYYFPISNISRRRQFYEDAQQCQSRCSSSETRLFYMRPSSSINEARDQTGLAYDKLKTAFLYRKKLQKNCTCRPQPWSVSERLRHKSYTMAMVDGAKPVSGAADNEKIVPAAPKMIGEGAQTEPTETGVAAPVAVPVPRAITHRRGTVVPPAPKAVMRPVAVPRPVSQRREAPAKQPSGLAALFGAAPLPKSKFRYRWPGDTN